MIIRCAALAVLLLAASAPGAPGLSAEWLYNAVDRPALVHVDPPSGVMDDAVLSLVLMNALGHMHAEPVRVRPGSVDLYDLFPDIDRLRRAAYLQLLVDQEPVGSALVVQPMLSRLVPVVEEAVNPSGITYTKVVGWIDEQTLFDPPTRDNEATVNDGFGDDDAPAPVVADDDTTALPPSGRDRIVDPWLSNRPDDGRLFNGLRLYADRDVVMHTSDGDIRIALTPEDAPNTAWNFRALVAGGFYRDIPFHRVVPFTPAGDPFVIQAGDPTPSGSGGPGYWLPIEPSRLAHDFGVISMARDVDPDSAGSQIFICLSREGTARLDGHYCAFGYAVDGAATIQRIAGTQLADVKRGRPLEPPLITSAELVPAPPREPGQGRPDERVAPVEEKPETTTRPGRVPR